MLNGDSLHADGFLGEGQTIAILDAGYTNVDELRAFDSVWMNEQVLATWDFVKNTELSFDTHTHGTAVFSILASNLPGEIIGVAPHADYFLLRTEIGGPENIVEEYHWLAGAQWADSAGADIITSSLCYTLFNNSAQNHTYEDLDGNTTPITKAADMAASKGILVINSAGNYADDPWNYIGAPADGDSVIAVAAVSANQEWAGFSSLGPSADGRVKPNVAAQGQGTFLVNTSGSIQAQNGTSFSAPIIAGLAACLWQCSPELNNMQILKSIEKSAHLYNNPNDTLGYGLPDFAYARNLLSVYEVEGTYTNAIKNLYPNPAMTNAILVYESAEADEATIRISDIHGRLINEKIKSLSRGENIVYLDGLSHLKKGIYLIQVYSSEGKRSAKLFKK